MPYNHSEAFTIVELSPFDFNAKNLLSTPEPSKQILSYIEYKLLTDAPKNASVKETKYTTLVDYNNRRMTLSVWVFKTADCPTPVFKRLLRKGYEVSVVVAVHFFENGKFVSNVSKYSDKKLGIGLSKWLFDRDVDITGDVGSQVMTKYTSSRGQYIESLISMQVQHAIDGGMLRDLRDNYKIYNFFCPDDEIKDTAIKILTNLNSTFKINKETPHTFNASMILKDYIINVELSFFILKTDYVLTLIIERKYDETDRVYGSSYSNAARQYHIKSLDDLKAINFNDAMDYLYKNRDGYCYNRGSLGT